MDKRRIFLSRLKRRVLKHLWFARSALLALVFTGFLLVLWGFSGIFARTSLAYYFGLIKDFVFAPPQKIQSFNGMTNLLILGKGGAGHEAPDLTDTIIFTSFSHNKSSLIMTSIPRDIWIPALRAKLNSTYYWGNQKQENGGLILAKSSVEEIVGQPIHYGVVVDFEGFLKVIDILGGIEIEVENSFIDEKYPIEGRENDLCGGDPEYKCRYETIKFEKGLEVMDSATALKFVRSRNAQGDEGTDFARSARQQKVINAIIRKISKPEVFLSRSKMTALWNIFNESVETDLSESALVILARRAFDARNSRKTYVLPEDLLENPPKSSQYDNLYVFIPKKGDWIEVHEWFKRLLN